MKRFDNENAVGLQRLDGKFGRGDGHVEPPCLIDQSNPGQVRRHIGENDIGTGAFQSVKYCLFPEIGPKDRYPWNGGDLKQINRDVDSPI